MAQRRGAGGGSQRSAERPISEKDRRAARSSFSEMFFTIEDHPRRNPILFHHIQKTAGTALRKFIRSALPPAEREIKRLASPAVLSREALLAWYRDWYRGLSDSEREELCCVMSHTANYLLPALDRPVQAITVLREPVDRVISQFYGSDRHSGIPFEREPGARRPQELPRSQWTLTELYAELGDGSPREVKATWNTLRFFNGQSRSLLAPHHDTRDLTLSGGPPDDADLWRERLFTLVDERYVVGVQERFDEFVTELAGAFACDPWFPKGKVNKARPRVSDVPERVRETVVSHNWLDAELYARAMRRSQGLRRDDL